MPYYFLYFELLCLIVSLIYVRKLSGSSLIYFVPFLVLTNIQEWGSYLGYLSINTSNTVSLNIFTNMEFAFYSWFLYRTTDSVTHKKRIFALTTLYLVFAFINVLFIQGITNFHSYSYLIGSLLMVYYVCFFFYELFNSEEYIDLVRYPSFWICVGLLFFYLGMFTFYSFFELVSTETAMTYVDLFIILMNIFNIILYSCFITAFVCQSFRKNTI